MELTPLAISKAKEMLLKHGKEGTMIRLGVKGGSCSGYSYVIEFCFSKKEKDIVFEFDELKILIDPKSYVFLKNITLDYEIKLMGYGFKFINPDAKKECSCGKSFQI